MLRFWRNPEFIRYRRAELRPARAAAAGGVTMIICLLVLLSCWGTTSDSKGNFHLDQFYSYSYSFITSIAGVILALWCISACGTAISSERQLKTFDFLRTTQLTSGELLVGKLLGAPVLAYFVIGITLPLSLVMGVLAAKSWRTLLATYLLMLAFALFSGLIGLWTSLQVEKSGVGAGLVALFTIWLGSQAVLALAETAFPGFAAVLPLPAVIQMYADQPGRVVPPATFFGQAVPYVVLSLFLYATLGA